MYKIERQIQLTLSESCNLNCVYCYERSKSHRVMSLEKAKDIITREMESSAQKGHQAVLIYFHGGEICLHFERLKEICEWIWATDWNIRYKCAAATNGTLVHGHIQDWFRENSHRFDLGLSLDGNKQMHDTNRSFSYDKIDLDFFKSTWPNIYVKMTISPHTIWNISDGVIDIVSKGFKVSANLAYGIGWSDERMKYAFASEMQKLVDFFLAHPEFEPPQNLLQKKLIPLGRCIYTEEPLRPIKHCGTGEGMICYDMDGNKYPCQMFMPSTSSGEKYECAFDKITIDDIVFDEECHSCSLISLCSTCIGSAFIEFGKLFKGPGDICDYRKIEMLSYSALMFEMLKNKENYALTKNLTEVEVALTHIAIAHIQNTVGSSNVIKYLPEQVMNPES